MRSIYYIRLGSIHAAQADLVEMENNTWNIARLIVPVPYRGQGHGSDLLKMVCAAADEEGAWLSLSCSSSGPMTDQDLQRWYKRYGFTGPRYQMVRSPNATQK